MDKDVKDTDASKNIAVLIPAYNPDMGLTKIVSELNEHNFEVFVVNDGSDDKHSKVFEDIKDLATVISHEKNMGKGVALKTGIRYLREYVQKHEGSLAGFITVDADGQHTMEDILRISDVMRKQENKEIVLGVRNLKKDIPLRSKIGNDMSRFVYAAVTGRYLEDNQAGLRGFPIEMCAFLEKIEGNHYEYEMNMLVEAARNNIDIHKIEIETVYLDNNSTSHFSPVLDTARIQFGLWKKGLPSVMFYLLFALTMLTGCASSSIQKRDVMTIVAISVIAMHLLVCLKKKSSFNICVHMLKYLLITFAVGCAIIFEFNRIMAVCISFVIVVALSYAFAYLRRDSIIRA